MSNVMPVRMLNMSDAVGTDLHRVLCVSHSDTQSGGLYHGDIANSVADGDDFFRVDT